MALLRFTQSMSCWILPALGTGQPLVAQISTLLAGQPMCDVPLIWFDKTVNATSVLDYSVLREWIDCFFIAVSCFSFFYLLPQSLSFAGRCVKKILLHHMQQASAFGGFLHHHEMLLHNLWSYVHHSAHGLSGWPLRKWENWTILGTKIHIAAEQQLSAWMRKGYENPGRVFSF